MADIKMTDMRAIARAVHDNAIRKGFWDSAKGRMLTHFRGEGYKFVETAIPEKLALIHSEVSEALEAYRNHDMENFAEELADVMIRTMDLAQAYGIDIHEEVVVKHIKNMERPKMHGGKRC
jgi:NTP pyrophosphatase (non-canonical NTP hydrolase)